MFINSLHYESKQLMLQGDHFDEAKQKGFYTYDKALRSCLYIKINEIKWKHKIAIS